MSNSDFIPLNSFWFNPKQKRLIVLVNWIYQGAPPKTLKRVQACLLEHGKHDEIKVDFEIFTEQIRLGNLIPFDIEMIKNL